MFNKLFLFVYFLYLKTPEAFQLSLLNLLFHRLPLKLVLSLPTQYKGYFIQSSPRKNDYVIDGGGYMGNFSLIASRLVGEGGRVFVFEPDLKYCRLMKKRFKKLKIINIRVLPFGIFNKKTTLEFEGDNGSGSLILDEKKDKTTIKVACIDIDGFIKQYKIKKINFVKMDIEGAEIEAVDGMRKTIENFHPNLAIASYHIRNGQPTSTRLEKKLKKFKYKNVITDFPLHLTTYANSK